MEISGDTSATAAVFASWGDGQFGGASVPAGCKAIEKGGWEAPRTCGASNRPLTIQGCDAASALYAHPPGPAAVRAVRAAQFREPFPVTHPFRAGIGDRSRL